MLTPSWGGRRAQSHAFTEQGVAMLSTVLRAERAIEVNIQIMRTFVQLRGLIASISELMLRMDDLERRYDVQFRIFFDAITQIMSPTIPFGNRTIGVRQDRID